MKRANLLLFFISLFISLLLGEMVLRLISPKEHPNQHQLFCEYDPVLGWRKIPNKKGRHITSEYNVEEKMNSLGLRGPEHPFEKDSGEFRILFLGDSYTEGYMVEHDELFMEVLKDSLDKNCDSLSYEVINAGTGGYSTDQELLFFENTGHRFSPDLTVLMFCTNDPWYNAQPLYWRGFKPQYVLEDDSLKLTNVPVPTIADQSLFFKIKDWSLRNLQLAKRIKGLKDNLTYKSNKKSIPVEWKVLEKNASAEINNAWQITAALLQQLNNKTAAEGSDLVVFYIPEKIEIYEDAWEKLLQTYALDPHYFDAGQPSKRLTAICENLEIPLINPKKYFLEYAKSNSDQKLYFEKDWHWNKTGNALVGEVLFREIGCGR